MFCGPINLELSYLTFMNISPFEERRGSLKIVRTENCEVWGWQHVVWVFCCMGN